MDEGELPRKDEIAGEDLVAEPVGRLTDASKEDSKKVFGELSRRVGYYYSQSLRNPTKDPVQAAGFIYKGNRFVERADQCGLDTYAAWVAPSGEEKYLNFLPEIMQDVYEELGLKEPDDFFEQLGDLKGAVKGMIQQRNEEEVKHGKRGGPAETTFAICRVGEGERASLQVLVLPKKPE